MDDLEGMNKLNKINYYDKEEWDEDNPIPEIPIEINKIFELKEEVFKSITDGVNVKLAYVKV
jgi:hypothetical protein